MDEIYELMKELSKHTQYVQFPIDDSVVVIPEDKFGVFMDGLRKLKKGGRQLWKKKID